MNTNMIGFRCFSKVVVSLCFDQVAPALEGLRCCVCGCYHDDDDNDDDDDGDLKAVDVVYNEDGEV